MLRKAGDSQRHQNTVVVVGFVIAATAAVAFASCFFFFCPLSFVVVVVDDESVVVVVVVVVVVSSCEFLGLRCRVIEKARNSTINIIFLRRLCVPNFAALSTEPAPFRGFLRPKR